LQSLISNVLSSIELVGTAPTTDVLNISGLNFSNTVNNDVSKLLNILNLGSSTLDSEVIISVITLPVINEFTLSTVSVTINTDIVKEVENLIGTLETLSAIVSEINITVSGSLLTLNFSFLTPTVLGDRGKGRI
jgi:hypothetical protein